MGAVPRVSGEGVVAVEGVGRLGKEGTQQEPLMQFTPRGPAVHPKGHSPEGQQRIEQG